MHLYDVEIKHNVYIMIEARNRTQAERMATEQGYSVLSINMVG